MAKIEMDISEYEAMKEVKSLLENSLKEVMELQKTIKKLSEEKIKALEDAKMKVVKTSKSEIIEHFFVKRDANDAWRELCRLLGFERIGMANAFLNINLDNLINVFFVKHTSRSIPMDEVTICGLDDVKKEIMEELNRSYQSQIEEANDIQQNNAVLLGKISDLTSEKKNIYDKYNLAIERIDTLNELNEKLASEVKALEFKVYRATECINVPHNFFNRKSIIEKLSKLLNN